MNEKIEEEEMELEERERARKQDLALLEVYRRIRDSRPVTVRELSPEDRRAYMRQKKRKSREAERAGRQNGLLPLNASTIRQALADAAIRVLADGGPEADRIRKVLQEIFSEQPAAPMTIENRVRTGQIRPKLHRPEG